MAQIHKRNRFVTLTDTVMVNPDLVEYVKVVATSQRKVVVGMMSGESFTLPSTVGLAEVVDKLNGYRS